MKIQLIYMLLITTISLRLRSSNWSPSFNSTNILGKSFQLANFSFLIWKTESNSGQDQIVALKITRMLGLGSHFLDLTLKAKGNRSKNKQVGLHQTKKHLHKQRESVTNEKATNGMGENTGEPRIQTRS